MGTEGQIEFEPLTDREREILGLIAAGLSNQQIADQIFLTLGTVKWYNKQTYQKLNVHSRTKAILRARELGLLGRSIPAPKPIFPAQQTVFIGRESELGEIQERLCDSACRLLTLVGPGGIGKTRLALEAARRQLDSFPDGTIFMSFAPIDSPDLISQTLAEGLGLTHSSQHDPQDQVIRYLREKSLLLVIDNFEHLLSGIDLLAKILDRSKKVKLLVTSRERLHLMQEWVFNVPGLKFPVVQSDVQEPVDLAEYEAGQLFLQTAVRVQSDFAPDESDQVHIARICQSLEGMPLGIELAASWVRLLPCAEIAQEITHGLDILTTSWRDIPERHQSIRAVLDHSWELLELDERDAFRKLTVFKGNFQREAGEAVAGASLVMLLALMDKSFLQPAHNDRYAIHELMKQYGRGKLRADPEIWATTQLHHCRYYASILNELMHSPEAYSHLREVEEVLDDLKAAWRFAVENILLAEIELLAEGFLVFYRLHSWYRAGSDALELYEQALSHFELGTANPCYRSTIACLYESLGDLRELATDHEDALVAFEKALDYRAGDDPIQRGRLYCRIADIRVAMNQHEKGEEFYALAEAVLEVVPHRDSAWWTEWFGVRLQRMQLYYWANHPDDMARIASEINPQIDQHGSATQRIHYLYLMGLMALRRDRYFHSDEAVAYSGKALSLSLETGNLGDIATRHFSYGFSLLWSDRVEEAETHLQIVREMAEQSGDLTLLARAVTYLSVIYRKMNDIERVRKYADDTLQIGREAKMPQYTGIAHAQFAWLAWRAGDLAETKCQVRTAIAAWGGLGQAQSVVPFRWIALFPMIGVALKEQATDQAAQWVKHMIETPQQRLPDALYKLLAGAVSALENDQSDAANSLLKQSIQLAQDLHYV